MSDKHALICPICNSTFFNIFPASTCQICETLVCGHCITHDHPDHQKSVCQTCLIKETPYGRLSELDSTDLITILQNPASEESALAAVIIAEKNDPASVAPLCQAMSDNRIDVKREASKALGILKDKSAVPYLLTGLDDPNPSVQSSCIKALSSIKAEEAVSRLKLLINNESKQVAGHAVHGIASILEKESLPFLKDIIENHDIPFIRCEALLTLSRLDKEAALESASACLAESDKSIQISACKILARLNDARSIPVLEKLIKSNPAVSVSLTAQSAIQKIEDENN